MTFRALAIGIFRDIGHFDYDRLNEVDRRRLAAAYVRDNPEAIEYLLSAIRHESIAEEIATLIEHPTEDEALKHCDVFDLIREIRNGIWPNEALALEVEAAFGCEWRRYCAAQEVPALARRQAN